MLHFDDSYACNSTLVDVKGIPCVTFTGSFVNAKKQNLSVTYYWAYDAGHSYPVAAVMHGDIKIFGIFRQAQTLAGGAAYDEYNVDA